ncbi:TetR/AcrR family transcriptional regulator C-terminal domain-containing protein [Nocardia abscessus]|uniref:TetR/AcrR family transcriptional regulator C-terminal domain-containing protein n=1 Tax=Nocardia abscessus TaxID=120957 RepID=A0ABS0CA12_9NOCA|nr:TetR/AcrR family transcriptional regulator C-terminal domain-containing protein [Nocardia abscessus]MBF6227213.1 TetR/AcrR family transcriptional regulator C-terminal domain-containing protein [Nocardia abscessus]
MPEPPYRVIATEIAGRIERGELRPGERVPSTREIMARFGVAMATATKVLAELRSRGLVLAVPGVGTVVADWHAGPPKAYPGSAHTTRDRILRTAIALADAEGLGAVSMRRIAIEMNVPTTSLYRWVTSKDDLLGGILDELIGWDDWPEPPDDWRGGLEYVARRQWASYRARPWLADVASLSRPQLAPKAMAHTEWALAALAPYALDDTTKMYVTLTVFGHVKASAALLAAEREAQRDSGIDNEQWFKKREAEFAPIFRSGRYPRLAKVSRHGRVDYDLSDLFEFGLTTILEGIQTLLADRCPKLSPLTDEVAGHLDVAAPDGTRQTMS